MRAAADTGLLPAVHSASVRCSSADAAAAIIASGAGANLPPGPRLVPLAAALAWRLSLRLAGCLPACLPACMLAGMHACMLARRWPRAGARARARPHAGPAPGNVRPEIRTALRRTGRRGPALGARAQLAPRARLHLSPIAPPAPAKVRSAPPPGPGDNSRGRRPSPTARRSCPTSDDAAACRLPSADSRQSASTAHERQARICITGRRSPSPSCQPTESACVPRPHSQPCHSFPSCASVRLLGAGVKKVSSRWPRPRPRRIRPR